ncbi:MAG: TAXI family TRAP transporter solute-binding subunit [Desulfobacterales bacterium]|nr:TAXI family TRAP transporter solute-binding subunit [Desulfobacterales bacterium]
MQSLLNDPQPARNQASGMRVNALIQIAYGMSRDRSDPDFDCNDLRVSLGTTRDGVYQPAFSFANGDYTLVHAVVRGDVDLASINPSGYLNMAYRGTGLFREPAPVRVIAVMPTWDRMFFAVSERTGLTSLADIAARKYPLRLSIRRSRAHGTRFLIDELLAVHGFSLRDLEAWGGRFTYVDTPNDPARTDAIRDATIEAVFDEGVKGWGFVAADHGMKLLDLDPRSRARLEELGWPVGPIRSHFPAYKEDITAVSFGGWPLFTREDLPEPAAYRMARALGEAMDRIVWDTDTPVQLPDLCVGTDAAPRDVPLHPGAARYYREKGCPV